MKKILTREDILQLKIGDVVPNVFGTMKPIVRIVHRGYNKDGNLFVYFYQKNSEDSSMSHSLKEGDEIEIIKNV